MKIASALALMAAIAASQAQAQQQPQWILRAGAHPVQPKPHNHEQLQVGDGTAITFAATYMLDSHWGLEAFAALPVEHEIALKGSGLVANIHQLPATLSLQYHFPDPNGRIRGFLGAGINRTTFFDESTGGAWQGSELHLAESWGPALQAGLDFDIGQRWFISIDARWFDIDTSTQLSGANLGTVEIDPYAVGMTIGRRWP
ncbi:MAG TPA: OmpW family outer membrane protein [Steroidobacteraceae bacterium]|nr:OmpW family outer membrane protein [Steroidobacteraceae bacterium]